MIRSAEHLRHAVSESSHRPPRGRGIRRYIGDYPEFHSRLVDLCGTAVSPPARDPGLHGVPGSEAPALGLVYDRAADRIQDVRLCVRQHSTNHRRGQLTEFNPTSTRIF